MVGQQANDDTAIHRGGQVGQRAASFPQASRVLGPRAGPIPLAPNTKCLANSMSQQIGMVAVPRGDPMYIPHNL